MASSLFEVKGKIVLVTGGGRGIGRMIAEGFAKAGAQVFITSRKFVKCQAAAAAISRAVGRTNAVEALPGVDLGKGEQACAAVVRSLSSKGVEKLDVLVNNSGCSWGEPLEKYQEKGFDKVMNLNVKGLFFLTKLLLPLLSAAGTADNPARVINIGSVAGIRPQKVPTFAYDASKAAVHHLTRQMAAWLAPENVTCNVIAPGLVPSAMSKQLETYASQEQILSSIPLGRVGAPADMAGAAIFLSSKAGAWCTGIVLVVDGGALVSRL